MYEWIFLQDYDNGDSQLDSTEFLKFLQHNETAINITSYADEENNRLLRWARPLAQSQ